MKGFPACSILLLVTAVSYGQRDGIARPNSPVAAKFYSLLPTSNWVRTREVPVFKSKADSLACIAVQTELNTPPSTGKEKTASETEHRRDSLNRILADIYAHGTTGTRQLYFANPTYRTVESLRELKDYTEVKRLSITDNDNLPEDVLQYTNLEKIEFVNTSIKKLPQRLNALPNLRSIEVYHSNVRFRLTKNTHLQTVTLEYNQPASLPRSYKKIRNLETLHLAHNGLTKFVNGARHNKKLKQLDLSDNVITLRNDHIARHKSLKNLVLTRNKITHIPASICNLAALGGLTLAYNSITTVALQISKLQKLEQLSFYRNQLPAIPSGVFKLTSLRDLDLYYNQIETVPDSIAALKNLTILYLAFNKIVAVTDSLGALTNLRQVYLHNNRIGMLPESLAELKHVQILGVSDNYLTKLPASLSSLTQLQHLDIAGNNFRSLNVDLSTYNEMTFLDLSKNPWETSGDIATLVTKLAARGVVVQNFPMGEVRKSQKIQ